MNTHLKYYYACGNTPILGILITSVRPQENCLNNHNLKLLVLPYTNFGIIPLSHLSGRKIVGQPGICTLKVNIKSQSQFLHMQNLCAHQCPPPSYKQTCPLTHIMPQLLKRVLEFFKNYFLSQFMSFTRKSVLLLYNYTFFFLKLYYPA